MYKGSSFDKHWDIYFLKRIMKTSTSFLPDTKKIIFVSRSSICLTFY